MTRSGGVLDLARKVKSFLRRLPGANQPPSQIRTIDKLTENIEWYTELLGRIGYNAKIDWYEPLILRVGNIADQDFFRDKAVVDIGCGPLGSLSWLTTSRLNIGLDPLAVKYANIRKPDKMFYVCGVGEQLPFRSASVDIIITTFASDYFDSPQQVFDEIKRVLKPGGYFVGSLNLRPKPKPGTSAVISKQIINQYLYPGMHAEFERIEPESETLYVDAYRFFEMPPPSDYHPQYFIYWCRLQKLT
jgi:SAM-dependent methyltransferase